MLCGDEYEYIISDIQTPLPSPTPDLLLKWLPSTPHSEGATCYFYFYLFDFTNLPVAVLAV